MVLTLGSKLDTYSSFILTSESKKPGQLTVVYHYCNLSRFFLTQTLIFFLRWSLPFRYHSINSKAQRNQLQMNEWILILFFYLLSWAHFIYDGEKYHCKKKVPLFAREILIFNNTYHCLFALLIS